MERKIIGLARQVIAREPRKRPESERIRQWALRLAETEGIGSMAELDQLIYMKMYGGIPVKSGALKIRYWRTGRHLPLDREEALSFACALGLDRDETLYLLQAVMEKSDRVFSGEVSRPAAAGMQESRGVPLVEECAAMPPDGACAVVPPDGEYVVALPDRACAALPSDEEYARRVGLMNELLEEYIAGVLPARMIQMNVPFERLGSFARHLFCVDALQASALSAALDGTAVIENHLSSGNYESEFLRICRLQGEIPRRTMLRHIFLMGLPYLNRRLADERLKAFGYLPLTDGHTSPDGALSDDLVIGLLNLYEAECDGKEPMECRKWMTEQLRALDTYLRDAGRDHYRFLHFRSLETMARF